MSDPDDRPDDQTTSADQVDEIAEHFATAFGNRGEGYKAYSIGCNSGINRDAAKVCLPEESWRSALIRERFQSPAEILSVMLPCHFPVCLP